MHSSFFVEYLNSGHYNFTGTTREGHARWVMKVGEFLSFFFALNLKVLLHVQLSYVLF